MAPGKGPFVPEAASERERAAIIATATRLGLAASPVEELLDRIDAEYPELPTAPHVGCSPQVVDWPTRQDAVAWALAAICDDRPAECVAALRDASDLRQCITMLAAASDLISGEPPLIRKAEIAGHLSDMARFLNRLLKNPD